MKQFEKIKSYYPIFIWPILVLIIHLLSQFLGFYDRISWLDTPMHFLGGMAIAASAFFIFKHLENKKEFMAIPMVKILLAIALTALAAVMWEQVEFASDTLFHTMMQPSNWDTMKDLTMGLLGASVMSLLWKRK